MRNFDQQSRHKLIQMLKLADKDIKIIIIIMFCIFKKLEHNKMRYGKYSKVQWNC